MSIPALNILAALGVGGAILWLYLSPTRVSLHLPPGPKPLPILGNIRDFMSLEQLWVLATRWRDQFGDVCYLTVLGQGIVFLNNAEAVTTLLEKRGAIYSDRPYLVMTNELIDAGKLIIFEGYNEKFRRQRKLMQHTLGPRSIPAYHPMMRTETASFIRDLVKDPGEYMDHTRKYAGGLMLSVLYGYKATHNGDEFLRLARECMAFLANEVTSGSGVWPVDIFPVLKYLPAWMPGGGFQRKAAYWKKTMRRLADEPFQHSKTLFDQGVQTVSFCGDALQGGIDAEEDDIKWTASSMYIGSSETTISTVSHFLLAIISYPAVLAKLQLEIDTVVGRNRLPDFEDRPNLPYIEAVLSETWRWGVPAPINLPHRVVEDDVYDGMHIRKGSLVLANIWAILRDESIFSDASEFRPERFLEEKDPQILEKMEPRKYIFGFGRRACPGADLVESSIWLLLVTMVATLDLFKPLDDNGDVIEPDIDYGSNAKFRIPSRFKFDVRFRTSQAATLMESGQ
ncbi:cytochrome P450 [Mycena alexandri]|uniref:Cytochrome P450 n=1 Tax=Mycena alexandri TaxID=1745969 RepID=A0AAD6T9V2_9AGAR|nr:cytochrome P450 [Mycena alexandri]